MPYNTFMNKTLSNKFYFSHTLIEITSEVFKMGRSFEANVTIKEQNISIRIKSIFIPY